MWNLIAHLWKIVSRMSEQDSQERPMPADRCEVAAIAVVDLARELRRHSVASLAQIEGIDRQLAAYVLALERKQDISEVAEMRYPEAWLIALWQLAGRDARNQDIGVRIGATVSPEARGLLANMVLHCGNLKEALETYLANISLLNASETWQVVQRSGEVELIFSFAAGKPYPHCAIERSMVSFYGWAKYYCAAEIPLRAVEFAFPEPNYSANLRAQFPCNVRFDSERHAFVVEEDVLSWPLPQRNLYLRSMLERRVVDLGLSADSKSVEAQVRRLLRKNMPVYQSASQTARTLCMSRATLYRKLKKEEKTSFSRILDDERRRLWRLHDGKPASQLVDLLGFKDVSAYYKARKRWR